MHYPKDKLELIQHGKMGLLEAGLSPIFVERVISLVEATFDAADILNQVHNQGDRNFDRYYRIGLIAGIGVFLSTLLAGDWPLRASFTVSAIVLFAPIWIGVYRNYEKSRNETMAHAALGILALAIEEKFARKKGWAQTGLSSMRMLNPQTEVETEDILKEFSGGNSSGIWAWGFLTLLAAGLVGVAWIV
jgi:hypothetical protein